ncbi:MAG: hypothetical protein L0H31_05675 [Nocardioidaceae bacterium]|nr:hypothetical protein [Nocardioidaceae bacterium]
MSSKQEPEADAEAGVEVNDEMPGTAPNFDLQALLKSRPCREPTPGVDDATYPAAGDLLAKVIDHYLTSREFNGLPVGESPGPTTNAEQLIREGLSQLVTSTDYLNTHIRPWLKNDTERQVNELSEAAHGKLQACLYPTPTAMQAHAPELTYAAPYRDRMTMGYGTLELAFFDLAALETYVHDPAFSFTFGDDGFRFATAPSVAPDNEDASDDEAAEDSPVDDESLGELDDDLLAIECGYAYDHRVDYSGDEPISRHWCAFLHDLVSLPARHQTRLSTFERDGTGLVAHPEWWDREIGGRWTDSIGPFTKILWELEAINDVWTIAFGTSLFSTVERPRAWGWVLRPTTGAWNDFILLTDKLLSDNLRHKGLDAASAPKTDEANNHLGSLSRLQELFIKASSTAVVDNVRYVLQPLRDVRKERQSPAHRIEDTTSDANIVNRQRDLLRDVAHSLHGIRTFVQTHPKVRSSEWKPPALIDNWRLL